MVRRIVAVCVLLATSRVSAQTIDYGATEQLFGEPITTSVTGSPQRSSDVPATIEIITADEIRRSGARDIPGLLRHVAGLDVLQWHNDDTDVAVRGYNQAYSPRLLVLIDGRQVYADYDGYTPWTALPVEPAEIRQIEVIKGPNSALFGFNAVGGVINIVTYNPLYDRIDSALVAVGSQALGAGSVVATASLGRIGGARISAGSRSNDDFSTPERPSRIGSRRGDNRSEVNLRTALRLGRNVGSDFEASTSASDEAELTSGYITDYAHYDTKSAKLELTADTRVGLVVATAYSNWITLQGQYPPISVLPNIHAENQVAVAQLRDLFKIGRRHTFRASLEYRHNTMPTIADGAQISYDVTSAAGMWDWTVAPSLSLTNAFRVDHLSLGRKGPRPAGYGLTNADWNGRSVTEASAKDLRWSASYTPEVISDRFDPGFTLATTATDFAHTMPVHVANANIGWAQGPWEADGYLRYESAFYGIERAASTVPTVNGETLGLIPAYVSVDSRVGYKLSDRLTLSVAGQNVMHSHQRQTSGPDVERRVIGTLKIRL